MTEHPASVHPARGRDWLGRRSLSGLAVGLAGFLVALTPSLLPRPPILMGALAGLAAALGYGAGVAAARLLHRLRVPCLSAHSRARIAPLALLGGVVLAGIGLWSGMGAQDEVRAYQGLEPQPWALALVVLVVAGASFRGILWIGQALHNRTVGLRARLGRRIPPTVAGLVAFATISLVTVAVLAGIVAVGLAATDRLYADKNEQAPDWAAPPTSPLRSGGPGSLVGWDTLGYEGRAFIAGGPTPRQLTGATGLPAVQPIRVYAGLDSAGTPGARAQLVVAELERTGAFDRPVLVVAGVAGTGWVNPAAVDALEYVWAGDTAIAATQYSYLPSWISTLVDQDKARLEGRALVDAVWQAWSQRPADHRPRLRLFGESLGSYEIQAAFNSADDLIARTDGSVLVGTPSMTPLWQDITESRDEGSPQWQPVVDGGSAIRFSDDGDFASLGGWAIPRIGFLQHADDPVVWWNFDLIANRPDWLMEPRGPAISPRMRWIPGITFVQVAVDQMLAVNQHDGFGHNYGSHMVQAWAQVAGTPTGWTDGDLAAAQRAVAGG